MQKKIEGYGNDTADVMFIYSLPSEWHKKRGSFYPDGATQKFCNRADVSMHDCYFTGAIKNNDTPKKWKPKKVDYDENRPLLEKEIAGVKPKYIVLFGAEAVKMVLNGKIMDHIGGIVERDGIKYIICYNPAIVYFDANKQVFIEQASDNLALVLSGGGTKLPKLNIKVITNIKQLRKACKKFKGKLHAYDIETSGLDRFTDKVKLFGFGNCKVQYIIPLSVKYSPLANKPKLQWALVRTAIQRLNGNSKGGIAGNGKFDNLFCEQTYGIKPHQVFDVVLGSHILNENTPNRVKDNAMLEFNVPNWEINLDLKKGNVKSYEAYEEYLTYLGYDIYFTYKLYRRQKKDIKAEKLDTLYNYLYLPAIKAFEKVETAGVHVRQDKFAEVDRILSKRIRKAERKLQKVKKINWGANDQVAEYLFEEEGLPVIEKTDSGKPSVNEAVMKQLMDKHPMPAKILAYRKMVKQRSTYIDAWKKFIVEGRMHPSFKMLLVTGRTSCSDPNLQQVPNDPFIRSLIGARKGRVFVEIDFSQAELRVATILSGDKKMTKIYKEGGDIHSNTYTIITGEKVSSDHTIKKAQRRTAKSVNFGYLYGMGWRKYIEYARDSYDTHVTADESKVYRANFFKQYNGLPRWHEQVRQLAHMQGFVTSPLGRVRRLPDIFSKDRGKSAEAERQAINSPVQGMGSDILLLALAELMQTTPIRNKKHECDLTRFDCMGTVHDAGLFEVDEDYLEEFIPKAKAIFQKPKALRTVFGFKPPIPIVADVSIGDSWGEEIELEDDTWREQVKDYLREGMPA